MPLHFLVLLEAATVALEGAVPDSEQGMRYVRLQRYAQDYQEQ